MSSAASRDEELLDEISGAMTTPPAALASDRYDASHEVFERASDQQARILDWLASLARDLVQPRPSPRIASIGCGSGLLDLPLIESLIRPGRELHYHAIDPNETACDRFRAGFAALRPPGVELELEAAGVDDFAPPAPLDLVIAVHSLYYVADPGDAIARLRDRLAPDGRLVVLHGPRGVLNRLAERFWAHHHETDELWFSERLEHDLLRRAIPHHKSTILGRVDASACFEDDADPLLLDFLVHAETREAPPAVIEACRRYLESVGRRDGERLFVPHPVDAFVIEPDTPT